MKWAYHKSGIFPISFPDNFFDLNRHVVVSFLKIYVYLKNILGILDRNDTSYISDLSSIKMFQLDETAENQPQSAPISAKGTKDFMLLPVSYSLLSLLSC